MVCITALVLTGDACCVQAGGERFALGANNHAMRTAVLRTGWLYGGPARSHDFAHGFTALVAGSPGSSPVPLAHACDVARAAVAATVCLLFPQEAERANEGSAGPLMEAARRPWNAKEASIADDSAGGGSDAGGPQQGAAALAGTSKPAGRRMAWFAGKVVHVMEPKAAGAAGGKARWSHSMARLNEAVAR